MAIFDKMPIAKNSRGTFDLSKMHTTTGDFFRWDCAHMLSCVPGDVISLNLHSFVQAAPNPFPINGKISFGAYAFFVPYRLVWDKWTSYITDLESGLTIPYFTFTDLYTVLHNDDYLDNSLVPDAYHFLSNVMGLSSLMDDLHAASLDDVTSGVKALKFSALPLRALNETWFDWMRDKAHISDSVKSSYCLDSGGHITLTELGQLCTPKFRCYPKNYVTTAFDKPAEGNSVVPATYSENSTFNISESGNSYGAIGSLSRTGLGSTPAQASVESGSPANRINVQIQDLRSSVSKQNYLERMLVAGKTILSRFEALFGTNPTIEELQMVDYLGGHESDLLFQSSQAAASTSVNGQLPADHITFGNDPNRSTIFGQKGQDITSPSGGCGLENVTYKTDEHGFLVVMTCLMPVPQYFQGIDRDWFRGLDTFASDKFDFFHPDFENEGLQPVLNYEVLARSYKEGNVSLDPKGVFGFQQKYMDYKYAKDSLGGDFVNPDANALYRSMHLGRDIYELLVAQSADPSVLTPALLTQSTAQDKSDMDQRFTISASDIDHFIINHKFSITASRPMMQNALPALSANESRSTSKDLIETSGFRL